MPRLRALRFWSKSRETRGSRTIVTPVLSIRGENWKSRLFPDPVGSIASIGLALSSIARRISFWKGRKVEFRPKNRRKPSSRSTFRSRSSRRRREVSKSASKNGLLSRLVRNSSVELEKPRRRCQFYRKIVSYSIVLEDL